MRQPLSLYTLVLPAVYHSYISSRSFSYNDTCLTHYFTTFQLIITYLQCNLILMLYFQSIPFCPFSFCSITHNFLVFLTILFIKFYHFHCLLEIEYSYHLFNARSSIIIIYISKCHLILQLY
ncbi:MAG: hypothetical protein A370_03681 [Clostridium sp. Maddingley MBC34-26]|nr:MAG: hypothetical protein A370_03681 [Clostridium sp. Maddingley MBC34-26]